MKAYPSISAIPEEVDLAVVVTPPPSIPGIIRECGEAGVRGAIVISAGFKEIGPEGAALEQQLVEAARAANIRVIGPNCLGVMSPLSGLNATFATAMARPGSVGFISQSGALCTAVLDWSLKEMVGFSAFVSVGSMVDVGWGDLIYYLGNDPKTRSIVIYMETIGDARAFLSAAREVALNKPIIVIKPGRSAAAAKAAASHTGSLTGSDEVLEAAFRRCGVLRVNNIADLFYMAEVLAKQPSPRGPRLTIVTNAGGPGVLATDALIMGGGELAELTPETMEAYNAVLPPTWSHNNPVDIIGDASPERYAKALEIAAQDPNSDGMLVILTPQAMTDPTRIAEQLKPLAKQEGKPVLASWMGGVDVAAGEEILNRANIPTFPYPDTAARAFNYMWQYSYNLKGLYETPAMPEDSADWTPDRKLVEDIVSRVRAAGRTILTEFESKQVLAAYGIPIAATFVATDAAAAVKAAGADRLPGGAEAVLGNHHAQDRCRRRAAEPGQRGSRGARLPRHRKIRRGKGRRPAFPGRHRPADDQAEGRLRADHRLQPRPAVRPGAAVRHRRPAGRGLQGPRPGAAAAQHHAGAAHDGADQNLQGSQRRARPQAGGYWRRSKCSWCGSARWWPSSAGSRKSTSTRCWPRPTG